MTSAPRRRNRSGRDLRRRPVGAVDDHAHAAETEPARRLPGAGRIASRAPANGRTWPWSAAATSGAGSPRAASISSSSASGNLVPSREKNLMPLSGGGVVGSADHDPRRRAKAHRGVGDRGGRLDTEEPHVAAGRGGCPRSGASSSHFPEERGSRPTTTTGRPEPWRPSTATAARPSPPASSRVNSVPATPRTPSVPKSRPIGRHLTRATRQATRGRDGRSHRGSGAPRRASGPRDPEDPSPGTASRGSPDRRRRSPSSRRRRRPRRTRWPDRVGTASDRSTPTSAITSTHRRVDLARRRAARRADPYPVPGVQPSSPAAICERPALWTQTNSTVGFGLTTPRYRSVGERKVTNRGTMGDMSDLVQI